MGGEEDGQLVSTNIGKGGWLLELERERGWVLFGCVLNLNAQLFSTGIFSGLLNLFFTNK